MDAPRDFQPAPEYDFIVIGGGPAGSTFATLAAQGGASVLVLEGDKFPRFAIGEMIAPTTIWRTWANMGLTQEMLDARFLQKWGAIWEAPDGTRGNFDQDSVPEDPVCKPFVYNLDRALFDEFLLDHARGRGATCLEEAWVEDVITSPSGRIVGVRFKRHDTCHECGCSLLLDASGRASFLPRKLGIRMARKELDMFSVFAHYQGADWSASDERGVIHVKFTGQGMWFWWAPLMNDKVSVGVVADIGLHGEEYAAGPQAFFEKWIKTCEPFWPKIRAAKRISGFRPVARGTGGAMVQDYAAKPETMVGDGWALLGDAAGFIDPILAAQIYVAQRGAEILADVALEGLAAEDLSVARLSAYEDAYHTEFTPVLDEIKSWSDNYLDPDTVNLYIGWGSKIPSVRKAVSKVFLAFDLDALATYKRLADRLFRIQDTGKDK